MTTWLEFYPIPNTSLVKKEFYLFDYATSTNPFWKQSVLFLQIELLKTAAKPVNTQDANKDTTLPQVCFVYTILLTSMKRLFTVSSLRAFIPLIIFVVYTCNVLLHMNSCFPGSR